MNSDGSVDVVTGTQDIGTGTRTGLAQVAAATNKAEVGVRLGALAGCVAILIHSFFDFPLRTHANAYIFLLLVIVALTKVQFGEVRDKRRRERSNEREQ